MNNREEHPADRAIRMELERILEDHEEFGCSTLRGGCSVCRVLDEHGYVKRHAPRPEEARESPEP